MQKRNALISVSQKDGIVEFAQRLAALDFNIIASGGTADLLNKNGVAVTPTAEVINKYAKNVLQKNGIEITPEIENALGGAILDHRVVTLSREIHGGILAREKHLEELSKLMIPWIDLVCVDFYPLEKTIAKDGITVEEVVDQIDVGGPTMAHSTAKGSQEGRIIICDPSDREKVLDLLEKNPEYDLDKVTKNLLAAKADFVVSKYCFTAAKYRGIDIYDALFGTKITEGKGENGPQSPSFFYDNGSNDPLSLARFSQIEGIALGHINRTDVDRLLQTLTHAVAYFDLNFGKVPYFSFGVKHGNPCGGAFSENKSEAIKKMLEGDLQAIFGGFVITNFEIGKEEAETLLKHKMPEDAKRRKLDGVVASNFTSEAIEILKNKNGTLRLITNPCLANLTKENLDHSPLRIGVRGGYLKQKNYTYIPDLNKANPDLKIYGEISETQKQDLLLAGAVCATSNSNTITLTKNGMLIGNGVGQQSRVRAGRLAVFNATDSGHDVANAVAWSDSFFPFPDGPEVLIKAGVKVIFSTSGSIKDQLTIDLCEKEKTTLLMLPDNLARAFFGHGQ